MRILTLTADSAEKTKMALLRPASTVFFLCDIQERFAGGIQYWPAVLAVAQRMVGGKRRERGLNCGI